LVHQAAVVVAVAVIICLMVKQVELVVLEVTEELLAVLAELQRLALVGVAALPLTFHTLITTLLD
jgi:hypothetical protein